MSWQGLTFYCSDRQTAIRVIVSWPESTRHPRYAADVLATVKHALEDAGHLIDDDEIPGEFSDEHAEQGGEQGE